jgi:uncharacterized protein
MNKIFVFFVSFLSIYSLLLVENHSTFSMNAINSAGNVKQGKFVSLPISIEEVESAISENNINTLNQYLNNSNTPNEFIHYAVNAGSIKSVRVLLKRGANVNLVDIDNDELTPLMVAAKNTYRVGVEMSLLLIKNGAKVNSRASGGSTPLMFASSCKAEHYEDEYVKVVKLLIKSGARVNVKNNFGNTPLKIASEGGWQKIVAVLKKAGVKQNKNKS